MAPRVSGPARNTEILERGDRVPMSVQFRSRLTRPEGVGTWTFASIPVSVARAAGFRARMRVVGTIDHAAFRSSLMPRGGGLLFVVVPGALRAKIGKTGGDSVELRLSLDERPVVLRLPPDFRRALGDSRARFDQLAPSHRKAFLQWIEGAKQPETRARRVRRAVEMVRRGQNRN
jgi:hypothetical protein